MITKTTKFRTPDNNEFSTKAEAVAHEAIIEARKILNEAYGNVISTNRTESLILAMVHDPLPAIEALKFVVKKSKKATVAMTKSLGWQSVAA